MFRQPVPSTPFVGEYAEAVFKSINGDYFQNDASFLSTMRAIVQPRIKEGDSIYLKFTQASFEQSAANSPKETIQMALRETLIGKAKGQFVICNLRGDKEANSAILKMIKKNFCKVYKTFNEAKKIEEFYSGSFDCVGFNDPESKSAVIFVSRMTLRIMHYLQLSVPVIMPWFFNDVKHNLNEQEWALITSLGEKDTNENGELIDRYAEYMAAIEALAQKYDFDRARVEKLLGGYEERSKDREINSLRRKIQEVDSRLEEYNTRIMSELKGRNELIIRLHGFEYGSDERSGPNLMDYFIGNKSLYLHEVSGDTITFIVKTYLYYYDVDALKRVIGNTRGPIYRFEGERASDINASQLRRLLTATLIDNKLKMRYCAAYSLSPSNGVDGRRGFDYPEQFATYMPNPHINNHSCLGGYRTVLAKCLKESDYIGAIEQCVASAMSLNVLESASFDPFIVNLYDKQNQHRRCFEAPDGKVMSPTEALKWLDEEEKNEQKKAEKAKAAAEKTEG